MGLLHWLPSVQIEWGWHVGHSSRIGVRHVDIPYKYPYCTVHTYTQKQSGRARHYKILRNETPIDTGRFGRIRSFFRGDQGNPPS